MANQISPRGGRRTNIIPRAIPKRNIPALALLLPPGKADDDTPGDDFDRAILRNNASLFNAGWHISRYDKFGDEVFSGDVRNFILRWRAQTTLMPASVSSLQTTLAASLKVPIRFL